MSQSHTFFNERLFSGLLFENNRKKLVFINSAFLKLFDMQESAESLSGRDSREVLKQCSKKIFNARSFLSFIEEITTKDESVNNAKILLTEGKCIEFDFIPIKDCNKKLGNLWHFRNIREQKSELMSIAMHEFRTPLASMLVMANTLETYWQRMSHQKIAEKITSIKNNIEFLSNVMEKIMDLSLSDLGKIKFSPEPINFNDFLTSTIKEKEESTTTSHTIRLKVPEKPVIINIDPQLIKEVIYNIVSNSLKYSPEDSTVKIELHENQTHITVIITDQGQGIPQEEIEHIFDPFFRANNVGDIKGTGLGLALSKQFVQLHGGDIFLESQINAGTTCFISLPKEYTKQDDTYNF